MGISQLISLKTGSSLQRKFKFLRFLGVNHQVLYRPNSLDFPLTSQLNMQILVLLTKSNSFLWTKLISPLPPPSKLPLIS